MRHDVTYVELMSPLRMHFGIGGTHLWNVGIPLGGVVQPLATRDLPGLHQWVRQWFDANLDDYAKQLTIS
jgi:hypothetical protein